MRKTVQVLGELSVLVACHLPTVVFVAQWDHTYVHASMSEGRAFISYEKSNKTLLAFSATQVVVGYSQNAV